MTFDLDRADNLDRRQRTARQAGEMTAFVSLLPKADGVDALYQEASRTEAARIGGVTLQIIRDCVVKFNWPALTD